MKKGLKAVLFDFGGTLDTNGIHWSERFRDLYKSNNIIFPENLFDLAYNYGEESVTGLILSDTGFLKTLKHQIYFQIKYLTDNGFSLRYDPEFLSNELSLQCYYDVLKNVNKFRSLLTAIKIKYNTGIISNFYGNLHAVLIELKLNYLFDALIDSALVSCRKPDPEIYLLALRKLSVDPDNSVMVGDSYERDIIPAKSIGMNTIWLDVQSWKKQDDTSAADYIIKDLSELENILY